VVIPHHASSITFHVSRFTLPPYTAPMPKRQQFPVALTIAGSDSGGGAGIQADLKTFASLGVHGATVLTCVTAQNPRAVLGIEPCSPDMVRRQLEAVFEGFNPATAKTGMLYSTEIIRVVARFMGQHRLPLVVDPVMISTSGVRLLKATAIRALLNDLLPLARLVTPNVPEAEILAGRRIRSVENLRAAAREIHGRFGCAPRGAHSHPPAPLGGAGAGCRPRGRAIRYSI